MQTYVFLKRARENGALAELFGDGADAKVQEKGIGALGGNVLAQHAVAFVLIAELPDASAAAKISLLCNERGVHTEALRSYSPEEAAAAL